MTDETYSYAIVRAGERFDVVEHDDDRVVRVVKAGLPDIGTARSYIPGMARRDKCAPRGEGVVEIWA